MEPKLGDEAEKAGQLADCPERAVHKETLEEAAATEEDPAVAPRARSRSLHLRRR